ncbi:MAG: hypothetical protein ISR75_00920 [Phycisphaerales bacterium]|nr:hypothetical protein [Planctomycetota bacterium]MBL6996985.1 hypothetical protein [Phycisphaerales bacterium]
MVTENPSKSPIVDSLNHMVVVLPLPCIRCGYELRNLAADGDCPECGEPIRLTIIESIDPASRRLTPIQNPKIIGNAISGIVISFFISIILAVTALLISSPSQLPIPDTLRELPANAFLWAAASMGLLAFLNITPLMRMCQRKELVGCRTGIMLTGSGILLWSINMLAVNYFSLSLGDLSPVYNMLLDTCLPVISTSIIFSGFRKLIPRLGQRSRAFRQAQGSRQRMNDLLATLVVIIIGRTLLVASTPNSGTATLGLIVMVMSISLIVIGLGYLVRNTLWIRRALVTPPPTINELLRSSE